MEDPIRSTVRAAFAASDPAYLERCLAQRLPGTSGAGSRFLTALTLDELQNAQWEEYAHPAIGGGARGFRASIRGRLGIIRLSDLGPTTVVTLDDRKGTGMVTPVVDSVLGPEVDFTVLLLGPDDGKEVVWTFFPGEPINPSQVKAEGSNAHGTQVSVADAIALGLEWAKIG